MDGAAQWKQTASVAHVRLPPPKKRKKRRKKEKEIKKHGGRRRSQSIPVNAVNTATGCDPLRPPVMPRLFPRLVHLFQSIFFFSASGRGAATRVAWLRNRKPRPAVTARCVGRPLQRRNATSYLSVGQQLASVLEGLVFREL